MERPDIFVENLEIEGSAETKEKVYSNLSFTTLKCTLR